MNQHGIRLGLARAKEKPQVMQKARIFVERHPLRRCTLMVVDASTRATIRGLS